MDAPESLPLSIVMGPRTRLGQALLEQPELRHDRVLSIARSDDERQWLGSRFPWTTAVILEDGSDVLPDALHVTLYCCAAGPIHPAPFDEIAQRHATDDLARLRLIIQRYAHARFHVVLVSSALALALRPKCAAYTGWKCLLEGAVRGTLSQCADASISVIYPGRLTENKSLAKPLSLLYTDYARAGRFIVHLARSGRSARRVVGCDAHLWLFAHRALGLVLALSGRG